MDARSLLDDNENPTIEPTDVFDDLYEVEDVDFVADGFRPGYNHDREGAGRQDPDSHLTRSTSHLSLPQQQLSMAPSRSSIRSSIRKSRSRENPFASPDDENTDDAERPLHRTPSGNFTSFAPFTHRSISSTSSNRYARTQSFRLGAGGPSHPYGLYPQGTLARTSSVASASTTRPPRRSTSQEGGPRHPYALYPQGVADDSDDENDSTVHNPVPLGFMGMGQQFHRRRGPDGEEQDIVGFYGHTEQLPPYTRYPEDGPEKAPLLGMPDPPTALHSRAPVLGTDPGMSLMHDQLRSEPQSMTDATQLERRGSRASRTSRASASLRAAESARESEQSEKSWSEMSWKERRKTKPCGIPFWTLLLVGGAFVFIVIIVSSTVGGFLAGAQHAESQHKTTTSSSLLDVSLIGTPTATSPSPTGTWALNLATPEEGQDGCLVHADQRMAWDCHIGQLHSIAIEIFTPTGQDTAGALLNYRFPPNGQSPIRYGAQASAMSTVWEPFLLVIDQDSPQDGPAFYFQGFYDKVVVLPEDSFDYPYSPTKVKRDADETSSSTSQPTIATPSTRPWYCYWNNTFVEGFIYPNERAKNSVPSSSRLPMTAPPPSSSTYPPTNPPPWISKVDATPTAIITTTITMPSTTCTYTGVASAFPSWLHKNYPNFNMTEYMSERNSTQYSAGSSDRRRIRRWDGWPPYTNTDPMSLYPNLVKIEERRIRNPTNPEPYCLQWQVLDDWGIGPVPDAEGKQRMVMLKEVDPPYSSYVNAGLGGREVGGRLKRSGIVPGSCHCQWMSGQ